MPILIYKISGNSMLPDFKPGQKVLGLHWFGEIKKGDVVIVTLENREVIKRIIKINEKKLWLEGDNKKESTDSRSFGWVNKDNIIAKVVTKLS